ncbi:hypothetical protein A4A49_01276 [Nicotiana attenuata]|uniref:Uncharacterized protein n=1 Tax=Nicotiana attenuata TaxID=49451 RepID=A0A314L6F9_NICAT|nr:hypothetical protein A4A49_01276 [Nicotiana attenuata]
MRRQTRSMSSSPYSKSVSIEKSSNIIRETRSMSLSPHSTPVLVEKSIDEQNMRSQNRSDSVKVLESRKDIVGKSEKKKSKRKRVVEDEVNLGVKPKKKTRFRRQKKLKFLTKFVRGKLPIDDSDDFVSPPPKHIKEPVPPKKAPKNVPGVQPVDYDRELQKLKADVKQLHKQLNSFMEYVSDKFKEVFELINSKLGASEVNYGAHPEEDTSGRQDNNDFVSNMEFGGNEDVEMDGCQVGGSEGKDVPHSQRDTNVADQLGVNAMEGPSGVKVDMFVAKVTFTTDVAHARGIGEIADAVAGETEEESEKQKVVESQTGDVCATASVDAAPGETEENLRNKRFLNLGLTGDVCATTSVDAAPGETEEESEKQKVPESRTGVVCATASIDDAAVEMVLYNTELLPEVSPQMKKERDVLQRPCSLRSLLCLIQVPVLVLLQRKQKSKFMLLGILFKAKSELVLTTLC